MTLDRVATNIDREASKQTSKATEVGGAVRSVAECNVLNSFRLNARLLDGMLDGVGRHRHGRRHVKAATASFG
jgi:hypothetical protein